MCRLFVHAVAFAVHHSGQYTAASHRRRHRRYHRRWRVQAPCSSADIATTHCSTNEPGRVLPPKRATKIINSCSDRDHINTNLRQYVIQPSFSTTLGRACSLLEIALLGPPCMSTDRGCSNYHLELAATERQDKNGT